MRLRLHFMSLALVAVVWNAGAAVAQDAPLPPLTMTEVMTLIADKHMVGGSGVPESQLAQAVLCAIDAKASLIQSRLTSTGDVLRAELWPTDIGYVKLQGLDETGAVSVVATLRSWVGSVKTGLILDLRGAGGSEVSALPALDDLLSTDAPVNVAVKRGDGVLLDAIACGTTKDALFNCPVLVLVDGQTFGVSEAMAAVLKHYKGVLLLGQATMGDRALREWVITPSGRKLYLATRWLDVCLMKQGAPVRPDVLIAGDVADPVEKCVVPLATGVGETNGLVLVEETPTNQPPAIIEAGLLRDKAAGDPVIVRALDLLRGLHVLEGAALIARPAPSHAETETQPVP